VGWHRAVVIGFAGLLIVLASISNVHAHSPYWGRDSYEVVLPDGKAATIKVLFGDGIFIADPAKAVVIDNEGRVLAASPETTIPYLRCPSQRADITRCTVFDAENSLLYRPDPIRFAPGALLVSDGWPSLSPYGVDTIGFTTQQLGTWEYLGYEALYVAENSGRLLYVTAFPAGFLLFATFIFWYSVIEDRRKTRKYFNISVACSLLLPLLPGAYVIFAGDSTPFRVAVVLAVAVLINRAIVEIVIYFRSKPNPHPPNTLAP
jgi:hypothetical protein